MPSIADRLRAEREALGLTQAAMADSCGIAGRSQRNYEAGGRLPDAAYLAAAAVAGADVLYILTGQRATAAAPAKAFDVAQLTLAIGAVEEGLEETRRKLSPRKKAELVVAAYELLDQTTESRENVVRLVRLAA